jgi:hypothetical protein
MAGPDPPSVLSSLAIPGGTGGSVGDGPGIIFSVSPVRRNWERPYREMVRPTGREGKQERIA